MSAEVLKKINIEDFKYNLPDNKIAYYPPKHRDYSKLLIYNNKNIENVKFNKIVEYLPEDSLMVFNDTKVVQARLLFNKPTGAGIEIFCLEPLENNIEIHDAYVSKSPVKWKCLVGNNKKWKSGILKMADSVIGIDLYAEKIERTGDTFLINFSWNNKSYSFADILDVFGIIPLPPYIKRDSAKLDKKRYQTLFANKAGSVAAPTAGLHFTNELLDKINAKSINRLKVTLHVGAGTFKPVTSDDISKHNMHNEQFSVSLSTIKELYDNYYKKYIIVGTTSVRTLESLYWFGVSLFNGNKYEENYIEVNQWQPYNYEFDNLPSRKDVLKKVIEWMGNKRIDYIAGSTSLMIIPGYKFKMTDVLITNFHQPASTLLLLVSAFVDDDWKRIYDYAIEKDFKFLSYGDSCLLFNK